VVISPAPERASRTWLLRRATAALSAAATLGGSAAAQAKPFLEYLEPTPVTCSPLSSASWGVSGVLPRDLCNGIESAKGAGVPPDAYYWDGQILKAKDGKYHLFMSTWSGSAGFNPGWRDSDAYHAVSSMGPLGPYLRDDYVYSHDGSHRGHNVTALELPDGSYAVVVSETVPFTIYQSSSLDGPWTRCEASIQSNGINYGSDANFASNVSLVARHDGKYQLVQRHGLIGIADSLCGPYKLQKPGWTYPAANRPSIDSIYPKRSSIPGVSNPTFAWEEDPHIWRSGGVYHVLYSGSGDRVGYHLYSTDGLTDWTDNGLAFTPRQYQDIFCYEGGTCSQWYKMERPGVLLEDGHPTHITWAVADVDKDNQIPAGSNHGSKIIVVPFDGASFDADFGRGGSPGMGGSSGAAGASASGGASVGGRSSGGANGGGAAGSPASAGAGTGGMANGAAGAAGAANGGATNGGATNADATNGGSAGGGAPSAGSPSSGGARASGGAASGGTRFASGGAMNGAANGGAAAAGGNAGGVPVAGGDATANDSSGCGCVVGSSAPDTALARAALLGALGLLVSRRRRIHRRRAG
jgi:hypothetical protein